MDSESLASWEQTRMDNAEFFETDGGKWAGAASGLVAGAGLGATIGTMIPIPVIGTIAGAIVGGVAGGIAGAFGRESVEDVERDQTGGLTYDEFTAFSAKAVEQGLSMSAGDSKEDFKEVYLDMGYDPENFESVWESMDNMGSAFDELANSAYAVEEAERARVEAVASTVAQSSAEISNSEHVDVAEAMGAQAFKDYSD